MLLSFALTIESPAEPWSTKADAPGKGHPHHTQGKRDRESQRYSL